MNKCWYCDEELITDNNPEHIGVCDKCYNEMFKFTDEYIGHMKKLLNQQSQRIAELEEQLKNAIVPKFKFMEKVWHINKDYFYKKYWYIEELLINGFEYKIDKRKNALVMWYSTYFNDYKNYKYQEKDLFTNKEEAQAKLKELQGE